MKGKKVLLGVFSSVLLLSPFASVPSVNANSISSQQKTSGQSETTLLARGRGRASLSGASEAAGIASDAFGIATEIRSIARKSQNRAGFVRQVMETAYGKARGRYNVLVFNESQLKTERLRGVKARIPVTYDGVPYIVYIFDRGTFVNRGDGGYINWAFKGKFKRQGAKKVTFYSKKRRSRRRSRRRFKRSSISHSVNA